VWVLGNADKSAIVLALILTLANTSFLLHALFIVTYTETALSAAKKENSYTIFFAQYSHAP